MIETRDKSLGESGVSVDGGLTLELGRVVYGDRVQELVLDVFVR